MTTPLETGATDSLFDRELSREILRVERHRVTILAIVFGVALVVNLAFFLVFGAETGSYFTDPRIGRYVIIALAAAIVYEWIARMVLGYYLASDREAPTLARFGNAFIETSFPTIFLVILANSYGPLIALQSNIMLFYAMFIILSTLRLRFGLSAWTGLIAALQYAGICLWYSRSYAELRTAEAIASAVRGSIGFVVLGVVAGVVARQIRDRVSRSVHSISERNRVISLFGQHVSPMVVDKLLNQQTGDASEIRYVCMMFLDIRDFTTFSERTDPAVVINYLNTLFTSMIDIINKHHGIINKFLGDGFMAVFGAPLSHEHDCRNAVAAAQEILSEVERLAQEGRIPPTRVGIGLHAGEAITGNVGSPVRKEYTVIGDVVNVAARIEQMNKQLNSQLLISEAVWKAVGDVFPSAEALEPQNLKGRAESVHLWKLA